MTKQRLLIWSPVSSRNMRNHGNNSVTSRKSNKLMGAQVTAVLLYIISGAGN